MNRVTGFVDWMLRDRTTGKLVAAQFPNIPIIIWFVATGLSVVTTGTAHTILGYVATVALVVWAGDELLRGVNPFRRLLGAVVLAWKLHSLVRGG